VKLYRRSVVVFAIVFVVLGFAILIKGALDSAPVLLVFGALFVAAGAARLWLLRRS
jgi:uncharacterized membrane protein HdeD (DUF308 family)